MTGPLVAYAKTKTFESIPTSCIVLKKVGYILECQLVD